MCKFLRYALLCFILYVLQEIQVYISMFHRYIYENSLKDPTHPTRLDRLNSFDNDILPEFSDSEYSEVIVFTHRMKDFESRFRDGWRHEYAIVRPIGHHRNSQDWDLHIMLEFGRVGVNGTVVNSIDLQHEYPLFKISVPTRQIRKVVDVYRDLRYDIRTYYCQTFISQLVGSDVYNFYAEQSSWKKSNFVDMLEWAREKLADRAYMPFSTFLQEDIRKKIDQWGRLELTSKRNHFDDAATYDVLESIPYNLPVETVQSFVYDLEQGVRQDVYVFGEPRVNKFAVLTFTYEIKNIVGMGLNYFFEGATMTIFSDASDMQRELKELNLKLTPTYRTISSLARTASYSQKRMKYYRLSRKDNNGPHAYDTSELLTPFRRILN